MKYNLRHRIAALFLCGLLLFTACSQETPAQSGSSESSASDSSSSSDASQPEQTEREQSLGSFPYAERLKAADVAEYTVSDFVTRRGRTTGTLDSRVEASPEQLGNSNWYAAPSLTAFLAHTVQKDAREVRQNNYDTGGMWVEDAAPPMASEAASAETEMRAEEEAVPATGGGGGEEEPEHSETNVQVEGVDEADIIKTDGRYIYYLSSGGVAVVKAGRSPELAATMQPGMDKNSYPPNYKDLYISGTQLVVMANSFSTTLFSDVKSVEPTSPAATVFYIYDITNPEKPALERTVELAGTLNTSRFFNNRIYFVTQPQLDRSGQTDQVAATLPAYKDTALGEETYLLSPGDIHLLAQKKRFSDRYCVVGSFGLDGSAVELKAYEGELQAVYMSTEGLYLANGYSGVYSYHNEEGFGDAAEGLEFTTRPGAMAFADTYVNRFAIADGEISFDAMGIAPGLPINQYSMDEYQGTFRIATTYQSDSWQAENGVFLFSASTMKKMGQLEGLAPGETIKSVRFTGTTGYVVTYRQVDPLFVIDLRNPTEPVVDGELKIPGFSTYLHPISDSLVVGVGRTEGGEDNFWGGEWESGWAAGVKLSMFDVSNPKLPVEKHSLVLGNETADSEALYNPKSILFDSTKGLMALPLYYYTDEGSWNGGVVVSYGGEGFEVESEIALDSYYGDGSRFAYIGDVLYYACQGDLVAIDYETYEVLETIPLIF
ncbi:MAG: beta-propeller domain-containing protein [Oscillospiraceae bacterium]